ncbi:MAG TPA: S8 family serine peptidase [Flavisolibacter sp.]
MIKFFGCVLVFFLFAQTSEAQYSRHIIWFTDKASNPYTLSNPSAFLSARAINRRVRYNIALDSTDLPVTPRYVDSVRMAGNVTILNVSKWLNAVTILTSDAAALAKINSFPFVKTAAPIALKVGFPAPPQEKYNSGIQAFDGNTLQVPFTDQAAFNLTADFFNYGLSYAQVHIHNGEFLHNIGLRGQGMVIGMLDAGYFGYQTLKSFDSIRANGQILGTWDFVAREASVNEDHQHGMQCLSVIAANIPGQFIGTAPKASFYLFRSEDAATEYPIEEHNWVCAAERVDSSGGDVISSSLGYYNFDDPAFNYTYQQMNGNTTIAVRGADLAAKKGILVVNAAGNEGNNSWGKIITPADGDSVLAVGAVTRTGVPASFTSRGPSSDGQVKPDVASVGVQTVVQHTNNTIGTSNGTSFACPNMAGLATCLWQGFTEFNNMRILRVLQQAGNRFTSPNDTTGYGIPDVKLALMILLKEFSTASATLSPCKTTLSWTSKDVASMKYEIERKYPGQAGYVKVGEVNGSGSVFGTPKNYQFADTLLSAPAGTISYRIRQVIDASDSAFTADYIDTVNVTLPASCAGPSGNSVKLIPNPTRGDVTVEIVTPNASTNLVVRVFNSKGQLVAESRHTKQQGLALIYLPLFHLASGKYYVSVFDGGDLLTTGELIKVD